MPPSVGIWGPRESVSLGLVYISSIHGALRGPQDLGGGNIASRLGSARRLDLWKCLPSLWMQGGVKLQSPGQAPTQEIDFCLLGLHMPFHFAGFCPSSQWDEHLPGTRPTPWHLGLTSVIPHRWSPKSLQSRAELWVGKACCSDELEIKT